MVRAEYEKEESRLQVALPETQKCVESAGEDTGEAPRTVIKSGDKKRARGR